MNKNISHVFKELLMRAHAGAEWIQNSFSVDPESTLPHADIMNFIKKLALKAKSMIWQHTIPHQINDESLQTFN